jgi:hypothetical protein
MIRVAAGWQNQYTAPAIMATANTIDEIRSFFFNLPITVIYLVSIYNSIRTYFTQNL